MSNFAAFIDLAERTAAQRRWTCTTCRHLAECQVKFDPEYEWICAEQQAHADEQADKRSVARGVA